MLFVYTEHVVAI